MLMDGPDEITIDFSGKDGITAFEGENGCGKSTCVESLHHYPRLLSRGTKLWANCYSREAEKEFESEFMGHSYRSLVKIDAQTHDMEGFLFIDGSTTSCCNEKISSFEKKVEETFGKWDTFKRAQFSPQRSRETTGDQIDNMSPGDFRDILREYLNLQLWDQRSKAAKQIAEVFVGQIAGLDQRIVNLQENADIKTAKELERCAAGDKAGFLQDDKTILIHALEGKRTAVDTLKATIQQNALALERKKDLQAQIDRLEGELAKEKQAAESEIGAIATKWREIKTEAGKCETILANRETIVAAAETMANLESSLTGLVATIEEENQNVPVYQKRCHDLDTQIAGLRQQVKDLENDPENLRLGRLIEEAERAVKEKEAELKALDNDRELFNLDAQIGNVKDMVKALDKRGSTCPTPPPADCSFIAGAIRAAEILPDMETKRKNLLCTIAINRHVIEESIEKIKTDTAFTLKDKSARLVQIEVSKKTIEGQTKTTTHDLRNAQQVLIGTTELLTAHRQDLTAKRAEIVRQKALADKLPEIRVAEERKKDLEKQLAEVTTQGTQKKDAWMVWEFSKKEQITALYVSSAGLIIDDVAPATLLRVLREITEIETVKIPAVETEIQAARDRIAAVQAELRRIEAQEKEMQEVRDQREGLTLKASRWRYLQNFCGEKGYQAIAVASATPRIIKYANDLLTTAFDVPYTVRLKTQDDSGKEIFKVVILCPDGREVDLDAISGGQRSWAIPPLLLGMSLLSREESGREFDYFCVDEIDGAMSDENKVKCANFYPAFMKLAKLKYLPFITHCEAARGVADHRLVFSQGKSPRWG